MFHPSSVAPKLLALIAAIVCLSFVHVTSAHFVDWRCRYLIVPDAIPQTLLRKLDAAADRIAHEDRIGTNISLGHNTVNMDGSPRNEAEGLKMVSTFRAVARDDTFLELLDLPSTFPLLWDILGWNIQLYISHLIVYPPEPIPDAGPRKNSSGWHIDGGRPVPEMEERPQPRLSLKIGYFLSDTTVAHSGAMKIVPRSHIAGCPPPKRGVDPPGAIDVRVKPGTAVLFDRRLWHSRGNNYSNITRKVIFMGYSYRWLRGLDYNLMPDELLDRCSPIQRQLLGDGVNVKGWWQPTEEDVPLKGWLAANGVASQIKGEGLDSPLIFADSHSSPFLPARL